MVNACGDCWGESEDLERKKGDHHGEEVGYLLEDKSDELVGVVRVSVGFQSWN